MTGRLDVRRYTAFSDVPTGGNPAGVVLDATTATAQQMQQTAAEVGYSETAFVTGPITRDAPVPVRYFSPEREVDFCGHATIATAVAIGEVAGWGTYTLATPVGPVEITATLDGDTTVGSLRSPDFDCRALDDDLLGRLLAALDWRAEDLDPRYPPAVGFAGNWHPVLVAADLPRLHTLSYDFDALQRLCREQDWVTVQLVTSTGPNAWRARNPFPWGGVVEDPATGAAAAALAAYLTSHGQAAAGDRFTIIQGVEMQRPSRLEVEVLDASARIYGPVVRLAPDPAKTGIAAADPPDRSGDRDRPRPGSQS